jgi:large-conductance mechanosensitive channel
MIRLFIYTFVRFIIIALAIYFAFTLVKWVVRSLQGRSRLSYGQPQKGEAAKPKENYNDVHDAKFEELTKKQKEKEQEYKG